MLAPGVHRASTPTGSLPASVECPWHPSCLAPLRTPAEKEPLTLLCGQPFSCPIPFACGGLVGLNVQLSLKASCWGDAPPLKIAWESVDRLQRGLSSLLKGQNTHCRPKIFKVF